jgi:hypothetical protein
MLFILQIISAFFFSFIVWSCLYAICGLNNNPYHSLIIGFCGATLAYSLLK